MCIVSNRRHRFAAAAMTALVSTAAALTLGLTREAQAQAPLVPMRLPRHSIAPRPTQRSTAVLAGRSIVTAPRPGSSVTRDFLLPLFSLTGTANLGSTANTAGGWNSVGPSSVLNAQGTIGGNLNAISGRVAAIAVDPTSNSIFYVAAAGGGVWKTTDGGSSYVPLTDFLGDTAMGSIAVAPSNHLVIYAGTGEANNSGDSQYGIGLLKSTDGGASWSVIPGPSSAFYRRAISKIVVSPTSSSVVYLTTTDFAENGLYGNTGVWKTTDGGTTWTNVTATAGLDSNQPYTDLVMDPTHPTTLYAAIGTLYGDTANGVYKTTDGGTTWTKLSGFPTGNVGRISLALAASSTSTLYASVSNSADYSLLGLYKTTDAGTTWIQQTAAPNYLGGQGWYDNAIVVNPTNPNAVYAGGQVNYGGSYGSYYALAGSLDGGATFQDYSIGQGYSGPHTDLHALTFTLDGTKLLDGNDGGVWRLENPSAAGDVSTTQWSDLNANLGTIQFTGAALHPTDPTIAYGGSQDNGTEKYTGSTAWSQVRGGDGGFTRVDQTNPNTVYHEYYGISLERSDDGGATWNGTTTGINPNDPQPPDGADPAAFYVPFKLDPLNQARVIYGTDHIYESTDHGDNFTAIGTPSTAGFNPGDNIASTLGVAGSTIYAALGSSLYATYNDGASWTDVTIPSLIGRASDIYVNPANAKDVYVSCAAFGGGKVYHSTDGGVTWADITGNLPDEPFNAIIRDPATSTLYAGGDDGVYTSSNGGSTWSRFDPNHTFPTVQVVDLTISPGANLIAAATHGRGLFEIVLSGGVSTPTNLTAVSSYSKIALNWNVPASSGATYSIYRGTTASGESTTALATGVTATSYTDSAVTLGTTYYYKVKQVIGSSVSGASNEAFAKAVSGPPILSVPTTAYPTIQSAINAALDGYTVQVADGTFTETGNVDLDFGGKKIIVTSQNGAAKTTIDCGGSSTVAHRAFLFHSSETSASTVQGFTIQNANGTDEGAINISSGSAPTITACVFKNNTSNGSGAGINNNGSPTVTHCTFTGNIASGGYQSGAGIYNNGTLTLLDCLFTGNNAAGYGAGFDNNSGSVTATNCVFAGNTASYGGAILSFGTTTLINCTSTGNTGYGAFYNAGTATLTNTILYGDANPEIAGTAATTTYSDIQGGASGTGNINTDPRFVSGTSPYDLHLQAASPCLGKGTASGAPATTLDGYTRPNPPSIGAYELAPVSLPAAPTNLQAVAGNAQVTLTWTAPTGTVTSYTLYRGTSAANLTVLKTGITTTTFTNVSLTNGTTYYYAVAAVNSTGTGAKSSVVSATPTGTTLPAAPTNLQATAGNTQVTLTWVAPAGTVTSYTLYRGTSATSLTALKTGITTTTFTNTALINGTTYYYAVAAVNSAGTGPKSSTASATPSGTTLPAAPTNLQAVAGNAQVTLTWTAPAGTVTSYTLYRGTSASSLTALKTGIMATTFTNVSLTNGTTYYYAVAAVNSAGTGPKSSTVSATPSAVPAAPTNLQVVVGNLQATLSWTAPAGTVTSYTLYRGTSATNLTVLKTGITATTFTNVALKHGTTYYYTVRAVNASGTGPASNEVSATP